MKKILLLALTLAGQFVYAQNTASTCENAYSLCNSLGQPFSNTINDVGGNGETEGFGCLLGQSNRSWFSLPVAVSGTLSFTIEQETNDGVPTDVNFIAWGPFDTPDACGAENLNPGTQVACSYSASATEQLVLPNAVAGTYYIVLALNFTNLPGTITFNAFGNTSPNVFDCEVAGVKQNKINDFVLYPNPAKNSVNITAGGSFITSVNIHDLTGKTIYATNANAASVTIDTAALAPGTYLTEIINSDNAKTIKKLIIN